MCLPLSVPYIYVVIVPCVATPCAQAFGASLSSIVATATTNSTQAPLERLAQPCFVNGQGQCSGHGVCVATTLALQAASTVCVCHDGFAGSMCVFTDDEVRVRFEQSRKCGFRVIAFASVTCDV